MRQPPGDPGSSVKASTPQLDPASSDMMFCPITPDEVAWACELLGRLSDKQWADAFRAGGFDPGDANRFITKLKEKIDQGRSLVARPADRNQQ